MSAPAAAAAGGGKAAPVLALFRQILRLHRDKLPPPMRAMGDTYVKDEFSKHLKGKTTEAQWRVFMQEWQRYHAMLAGNADILQDPAAAAAEAAAAEAAATAAAEAKVQGGGCGGGSRGGGVVSSAAGDLPAGAPRAAAATTTVSAAASGSCGELAQDVLSMLSSDQLARLEKLRVEAGRFGRGLLSPADGGDGGSDKDAGSAAAPGSRAAQQSS